MTKVLIDTNVLLDIMLNDRPGSNAAAQFLKHAESGGISILVSAGSLKDIYYISRKYLNDDITRAWIRFFMDSFRIEPIDRAVCNIALVSEEPDFEDGIIRAIAEIDAVDFILTRDTKAFKNCSARPVSIETFLDAFSGR